MSAVNRGADLMVVPTALVGVGAAWLVHSPDRPSALFTATAALVCIILAGLSYQYRHEFVQEDAETIRHTALTTVVVLAIGLGYLALGFTEIKLRPRRKKKIPAVFRTPR